MSPRKQPVSGRYDHSVFVNCPFDQAYLPLLRATVFTIVHSGFEPRTALDVADASEVRIHRIYATMGACRLGIHDLSRTSLDRATKLPRFNMPLELGIFLGAKFLGNAKQRRKACLVFDADPYRYRMYLSDVSGQDIDWHRNDPKTVVLRVRDWLAALAREPLPSGGVIWDRYTTFKGELRESCENARQRPDELTYLDFLRHVRTFKKGYVQFLERPGRRRIANPSAREIRQCICDIDPNEEEAWFGLGKGSSGLSYIQAWRLTRDCWHVEYQGGHLDNHYRGPKCDTGAVVKMAQKYAAGEEQWRAGLRWRRETIQPDQFWKGPLASLNIRARR
jgi:hypothetical protein